MTEHDDGKAREIADAVDALLAGRETSVDDPAVVAARRIRASLRPPALPPERRQEVLATIAGQWAWRRRRRALRTVLAIAAGVLLVFFATYFLRGGEASLPEHLRSRETATLIPGPFPPDQSARDRIDVIYADRLGAWRQLQLAPGAPRKAGPRRATSRHPQTASLWVEVTP